MQGGKIATHCTSLPFLSLELEVRKKSAALQRVMENRKHIFSYLLCSISLMGMINLWEKWIAHSQVGIKLQFKLKVLQILLSKDLIGHHNLDRYVLDWPSAFLNRISKTHDIGLQAKQFLAFLWSCHIYSSWSVDSGWNGFQSKCFFFVLRIVFNLMWSLH